MKVKTSELIGPALDWAVAKALGLDVYVENFGNIIPWTDKFLPCAGRGPLRYSTDWSQGGPLIEREKLSIAYFPDGWHSQCWQGIHNTQFGPTSLVSAMRCYVSSKLGDEIEVPNAFQ